MKGYQTQLNFLQEKSLIQYYIYEDFQNLINLLYSMKAIKVYFIQYPNHPAIPISLNKVILQLNISNSIHYDLQKTYPGQLTLQCIYEEKCKVRRMLQHLKKELEFECQEFIALYEMNSLNEIINVSQLPLKMPQPQNYNFNQNILNQLMPQIELIDEQIYRIKMNQNYAIPSEDQIRKKAIDYYNMTQTKLINNFPIQNQSYGDGFKQNKQTLINGCKDIAQPDMLSSQNQYEQTSKKEKQF